MMENTSKVASIILAPLLKNQTTNEERQDSDSSDFSAEEEFLAGELLDSIESKDLKKIISVLKRLKS